VSSKFDWAIPDSLAWLASHDIPAREVHFLWNKTLADCDVYLDDAPHQLEELSTTLPDATVCRMVHPWNTPMPGVLDVHSWAEFEAIVEEAATTKATRLR
jgi:5'(3')-deoxyribonucleotidase